MSKLKRLFKIVGKSMFKRNAGNILFIFCVAVMTILPVMLYSISQSIVSQVHESKQDVYGSFTDIYYQDAAEDSEGIHFTATQLDELIPGFHYDRFGVMYTVYMEELGTKVLQLGYADPTAMELGRVSLLKGSIPQSDHEIALTTGMMDALAVEKIGDSVLINGTEFTLVGEIEDYGWLWTKGEKQAKNREAPVNAFVTEKNADDLYQKYGIMRRQILLIRTPFISNETESNENFYFNQNNQVMGGQNTFEVPQAFLYILYVSSIFILFNVISLSRKRIRDRLNIYHFLGMAYKEQIACVRIEFSILTIIALFVGIAGSYLGTFLSLILLGNMIGVTYRLDIPLQMLFGTILLLIIAISAVVYFQSLFIADPDSSQNIEKRVKSGRNNVLRLALMELNENRMIVISYVLLISMSLTLLSYCAFYQQKFSKDTALSTDPTLLPLDYDYELVTVPINGVPGGEGTIYLGDSYELDGTTDEVIEQISNEKGVGKVLAFKENNKMDILFPSNLMDPYIDASDAFLDGTYDAGQQLTPEMRKLFGYPEDVLLLNSLILGYPEETLKDLASFIVEGEFNLDKLASGEEVILMVPTFTLEDYDMNGTNAVLMRFPPYPSEGAYNCSAFSVGDEITLSGLMSNKRFNGAVNKEEASKEYERIDKTVRIGAIIRSKVGKFFHSTLENNFAVLTLNEAFDPLGIPAKYNRLRIYSDNTVESEKLSATINGYLSSNPYMMLDDLQKDLVSYKRLNFVIAVFLGTIMTLVILVNAVTLSTQLLTKTRLNRRKYALLRINGLSIRRTIRIWLIQIALLGAGGLVLGVPITGAVLMMAFQLTLESVVGYLTPWKWLTILLLLIVLVASSLLPSIIYFRKHKENPLSQLT